MKMVCMKIDIIVSIKADYGNLKIAHTFQTISDILPIFIEMFLAVFYQPFDVMPSANFYTPVWKPVVLCYAPRHQSVHPSVNVFVSG